MRVFLIVAFLISGGFLAKLIFNEYFSSKKEQMVENKKVGLMNEIVIPVAMKDEYEKINEKYKKKFSTIKTNKDSKIIETEESLRYTELELKDAILNNKVEKVKETSNIVVPAKAIETKGFENKVLKTSIINEHLIVDIVIFNNTSFNVDRIVKVKCDLYSDDKLVAQEQKNGEMKFLPEEKIRIKDLNLGFLEYINFNKIECKVE